MNHIQISIQALEQEQEMLISELSDFGATGFEQTTTHLLAYFDEENFNSHEVNELIKKFEFQITTIPQQNWNSIWESNFEPVVVEGFCAIRADFHEPIPDVQEEIIITPKMSFGTGHHATTYMMIQQMQFINFKEKTVFDFGTGTGILAILAKRLGAAAVKAIDVDDWSITNAQENFERNKVEGIQVQHSSQIPNETFSIILANINRNVLLQYAQEIVNHLDKDGILLMSGLLKSDEEEIVAAFLNKGLRLQKGLQKGAWISLLFTN